MRITELIPSMFHRRLLLLLLAMGVPLAGVVAQLARLTLSDQAGNLAKAEERLVRHQWTPTIRGRILDRKGRVLASDRPSYNVTVSYAVIAGDWPGEQASVAAKRAAGHTWWDVTPDERRALVADFLPVYLDHVDRFWTTLADRIGISREELDQRRDRVISEVERKFDAAVRVRLESAVAEAKSRDDDQTLDVLEPLLAEGVSSEYLARIAEAIAAAKARGDSFAEATLKSLEKTCKQPIAEQRGQHTLAARVDDSLAFSLDLISQETVSPSLKLLNDDRVSLIDVARVPEVPVMPGLRVSDSGDRAYPYESIEVEIDRVSLPAPLRSDERAVITVDGVACHILGRMRDRVFAEDSGARREFLDRNPDLAAAALGGALSDRGGYRDTDRVGDTGIEGSQEHFLRGLRGVQTRHLDTGEVEVLDAEGGRDVALTLDIMLQARVQAAMSKELGLAVVQPWHHQESSTQPLGTVLNGAAVVLDIDTGDILAMVSTPTFTREQARVDPESVYSDQVRMPFLNRAIAKPYPPGSIVKAMVLTEAITRGLHTAEQRIACSGHLLEDKPNILRCWIYKRFQTTHTAQLGHDLQGDEAIMCSCNIFFFTLGARLDTPGITAMYRRFGVGNSFGLGVGVESQGHIGFIEPGTNRSPNDGSDLETPDAIQMGIGQGPIAWTPLHAANAYATIARRGVKYSPRLILGTPRPDPVDLDLSQPAIDLAILGLQKSVTDKLGTGHHVRIDEHDEVTFNAEGVMVWGKTGTADAPDLIVDPDQDGPRRAYLAQEGDHSWFVVLVGNDRPQYAVSVLIEYGGSGGKVSGPICNQIVHALKAEGYLK